MTFQLNKAWRFVSLFFFLSLLLAAPAAAANNVPSFSEDSTTIVLRGLVLSVENMEPTDEVANFVEVEQLAEIKLTSGDYQGEIYTLLNRLTGHPYFDVELAAGNRVILWGEVDSSGKLRNIYLQDRARDTYLYVLAGLFVFLILLVGGKKGLTTVLTLGITIFAVFKILLPMLLNGAPPIQSTILVAAGVTFITMVAIGGLHRKTFAALIGTVAGVLASGLLALYFGNATHLTGFSSEEAQMLQIMGGAIDIRGLLYAGIIIGALGAVMDVAMSISAASHEIYLTDPTISVRKQIASAMNVGRDVMGTMANTLILAYVGTSMSLLLLFIGNDTPYITIVNMDLVATEVVRAFTGSIGLIATVPLTAICSGLLRKLDKKTPNKKSAQLIE